MDEKDALSSVIKKMIMNKNLDPQEATERFLETLDRHAEQVVDELMVEKTVDTQKDLRQQFYTELNYARKKASAHAEAQVFAKYAELGLDFEKTNKDRDPH